MVVLFLDHQDELFENLGFFACLLKITSFIRTLLLNSVVPFLFHSEPAGG